MEAIGPTLGAHRCPSVQIVPLIHSPVRPSSTEADPSGADPYKGLVERKERSANLRFCLILGTQQRSDNIIAIVPGSFHPVRSVTA